MLRGLRFSVSRNSNNSTGATQSSIIAHSQSQSESSIAGVLLALPIFVAHIQKQRKEREKEENNFASLSCVHTRSISTSLSLSLSLSSSFSLSLSLSSFSSAHLIGPGESPLHQMALSRRWHRRRINNPATLTRHVRTPAPHLHPSRIRRPKHFGRIICSTRFDTRVSVVSYLRSNVAPSTRARARA